MAGHFTERLVVRHLHSLLFFIRYALFYKALIKLRPNTVRPIIGTNFWITLYIIVANIGSGRRIGRKDTIRLIARTCGRSRFVVTVRQVECSIFATITSKTALTPIVINIITYIEISAVVIRALSSRFREIGDTWATATVMRQQNMVESSIVTAEHSAITVSTLGMVR